MIILVRNGSDAIVGHVDVIFNEASNKMSIKIWSNDTVTINACVHQAPTANVAHATCAQKSRNWILVRSKMIISGLALRAPPTSRCRFFKWHLNVGCATRADEISANRNEYSKIKHFRTQAYMLP